jgi:hypothetical protein
MPKRLLHWFVEEPSQKDSLRENQAKGAERLAAAAESAIKSAPTVKSAIKVDIPSIAVSPRNDWATAKYPGSIQPHIPIAGARRNITRLVRSADDNAKARTSVSVTADNGPFKSSSVSAIESLFRPPTKILRGRIGGDCASSE